MLWIKYKVVQCEKDNETVLIDKKIGYSEDNLAIANEEAYDGYELEEDDVVLDKEPLSVELGGTGSNNAKTACENLGAVPTPTDENTREGFLFINKNGTTKLVNLLDYDGEVGID